MSKIKISTMDAQPTEIVEKIRAMNENVDLWTVYDKVDKKSRPVKPLFEAAQNLNVGAATDIDQDGHQVFKPRNERSTYHDANTWKAAGLMNPGNDHYPSITGGGLYKDEELWETAAELPRIPGRMIPEMLKTLWERINEYIDLSGYQDGATLAHPFSRLIAIQKMFIAAQNILYVSQDMIATALKKECEQMPRSFASAAEQQERFFLLVEASERAAGKPRGSMESDAMRTFLRVQLTQEHTVPFTNQGVSTAVMATINGLSQEELNEPGCLSIKRTFTLILATWRRVTLDIVSTSTTTAERALIASASAIVLEAEAKKHQPTGPKKPDLEEVTRMRKELADLKNKYNQLQEKMDRQERGYQNRPQRRPYRQGPQGQAPYSRGAPRGNNRGGYAHDYRKTNFRGGAGAQDEEYNDGEDQREKGYRVNVGNAVARRARVRVPEGDRTPSQVPKLMEEKMEDMQEEMTTKVTTRSQSKRKAVDEPEEPTEVMFDAVAPKVKSSALDHIPTEGVWEECQPWAWGNHICQLHPPADRMQAWEILRNDVQAKIIRRMDLLGRVGILASQEHFEEEEILSLNNCPEDGDGSLGLMETCGNPLEAQAMGYYNRLNTEGDPGMRLGIVRELNDIRDMCFSNLEEDPRMREKTELEHFWTYSEYHQARRLLSGDLELLARTTPSGEPMMEKYEQMCCYFVSARNNYVHEPFDEKIAHTRMERYKRNLDQGPQQDPAPQTDDLQEAVATMGMVRGLLSSLRTVQYGCKSSPMTFKSLITGRVVPPEGNGTEQYAGGAGLPIPEGCLNMELTEDQDGQSNPGEV